MGQEVKNVALVKALEKSTVLTDFKEDFVSKFYDKLIGIADKFTDDGYSGSKEEKSFLDNILSSLGTHPFFEEAENYKSLSKDERDNNLDAMRFKNIWG